MRPARFDELMDFLRFPRTLPDVVVFLSAGRPVSAHTYTARFPGLDKHLEGQTKAVLYSVQNSGYVRCLGDGRWIVTGPAKRKR